MYTKNYIKIENMRKKRKNYNRIKKKIIATVVSLKGDGRAYAKTKVDGVEILALLDSGANSSCLGKNALEFLKDKTDRIIPLFGENVQTADGGETAVIGVISLPVLWDGVTKEIEFLIVPELQQQFYFGIDFWDTFGLLVVSKGNEDCVVRGGRNESLSCNEISISKADLVFDDAQHELSPQQQKELDAVKSQFPSFAVLGLGKTSVEEHVIEVTEENVPIKQRFYPVSPVIQKLIFEELDRMLAMGVIEESNSSWSSPVSLVRKPGKNRLCLDARKVNERTVKDAYPLPHIDGILSRLQDTNYISAIDLKDAFWQIPLERKSREKTAFTVPGRPLYHFTVMPFGLCNAAQRMCRLMDKVIPAAVRENVFVYLDDLLICSVDFESHLRLLGKVAKCLNDAKLTINVEKSKFCFKEVRYLGYVVGNGTIRTDKAKIEAISNFPEPKTAKQMRRFLGMAGWYRRFIKDFATIAAPLTACLAKENLKRFEMTEEARHSFHRLKSSMTTAPVLTNPDFRKPFFVQCDASTDGVGGVLFQLDDEKNERPIAYVSTKLNKAQRNYSITELECYAAILCVKKFRPYIEGLPFTIITDHSSLKWLMGQKDLSGRLARWSLKLQGFDFTIEHRKGTQNVVPDTLSRVSMEEIKLVDRLLDIDLKSPYFESEAYENLRDTIKKNGDKLPEVCVSEGYVYKRTQIRTGDAIQEDKAWKLWVPYELQMGLVETAHFSPSVGHGGIHKTLARLREKYYWPGMVSQVQYVVKSCDVCKGSKPRNVIKRPLMGAQQITERPFQRIYIDFMGPYPRTTEGNSYIFVCLDHFTKFVFLTPMRKATSADVVKYLERNVFHIFGVPEYIHSDNGKQFVSEMFKVFLDKYGVKHMRTGFYSPQANASERVNRSVLQMIRSFVGTNQRNWDKCVSDAAFSLRSARHSAIGCEPYYALFGLPMMQHGASYELTRRIAMIKDSDLVIETGADKQQLLRDKVFKELKLAHDKSEKRYNTRSKDIRFMVGQVVYRKNFKQSSLIDKYNAKLAPAHIKCVVRKVIGNSLYELGDFAGKILGTYHAKDMFAA